MGADSSCCKKDDSNRGAHAEIVRARPTDHAGLKASNAGAPSPSNPATPGLQASEAAKEEPAEAFVEAPPPPEAVEEDGVPLGPDDDSMAPWPGPPAPPAPPAADVSPSLNDGGGKDSMAPWPGPPAPPAPPVDVSPLLNDGGGKEVYDDGSTYEGQSADGKRHGVGIWRSSFESYEGQWCDDQRHGDGRQTWEDGRLYEGKFKDGKFHGHGRMEWYTAQGVMIFEGQYIEDVKQGRGKYTWPDGRIYDGEWANGRRSGQATYINKGGEKKQGIWKDDKLERWLSPEEAGALPAEQP